MKFERSQLIKQLRVQSIKIIGQAEEFKQLGSEQLNFKKSPESWSILECLEHLNRYGDFYLVEIEKQLINSVKAPEAKVFKSGLLGNYFANIMLPKDGKVKKMKTFKKMDPSNSHVSITAIDKFLKQQERLLGLLDLALESDLTRTTTGITLTPFIRFRIGDTFRFFVNHIERHVLQAQKVLEL